MITDYMKLNVNAVYTFKKKNKADLTCVLKIPQCEWNFFGRNPCDGIGGTLKGSAYKSIPGDLKMIISF